MTASTKRPLRGVNTAMLWPSGDRMGRPLNSAFLKNSAMGMDSSARTLALYKPLLSNKVLSTTGMMRRFKTVSSIKTMTLISFRQSCAACPPG